MPLYSMKNIETEEVSEVWIKMADLDQWYLDNPNMRQNFTQLNIGDPIRMGVTKRHSALTDKLKALKKAHKGSNIVV